MDINRLRYFTVIVDSGSLSRASEILHLSQPALSKAMKVLEAELGVQLFVPNGRGLAVTDQGKLISLKARKIIQEVHDLTKTENHLGTKKLRIGTFEIFSTHFFGPLISNFFPDLEIDLHECRPGILEETLLRGDIDFGITYLPIPTPELDFHEITKAKMVVAGRKELFHKNEFNELPFVIPIMPVTGTPTKVNGLDGWPDDRILRNIQYRVTMMESALELCRKGLAVAYLPEFIVNLHNLTVKEVYSLEIKNPPFKAAETKQSVFLMKRKSDIEEVNYKKLAKALRLLI
jgi:DNA-binding transcriptional LysR family regulator